MIISVASSDPVLHVLAPIALAAAAGTALIVDRDSDAGWPFPLGGLEQLALGGPTQADLQPSRTGVALVGGPAEDEVAVASLVEALEDGWPAIVLRVARSCPSAVTIEPALPWLEAADVVVGTGFGDRNSGLIPAPPGRLVRRAMSGVVEPRCRWYRHWRPVWELAR